MVTEEHRREYTVVQVVNDDMPFLLDSTLSELTDQGYEPHLRRPSDPRREARRTRVKLVGFEGEATLAPRPSIPSARASSTSISTGSTGRRPESA